MQLVAYGAQDVYLTGNPQITFFKVVYKRHTNFSIEPIEVTFNGNVGFNKKVAAHVTRNGDLITKMYLRVEMPEVCANDASEKELARTQFAWVRRLGHALVEEVELEIGGSRIDKQYGEWFTIWYELTHEDGQERGYAHMIGDTPEMTELSSPSNGSLKLKDSAVLYVPLQFWFCRNNGLALPLIALQYHEVRVHFKFRHVNELVVHSSNFNPKTTVDDIENGSLLVDYIYLDTEERRRFAQVSHEYLVEQLQFNSEESITSNTYKGRLNFNHPSKALFWAVKAGQYRNDKQFLAYEPRDWDRALKTAAEKLLIGQYAMNENDCSLVCDVDLTNGNYCEESVLLVDKCTGKLVDSGDSYNVCKLDFDKVKCYVHLPNGTDLGDKVCGNIVAYKEGDKLFVHHVNIVKNDLTVEDLSHPVECYTADNRNGWVQKLDVTVWQHDNFGLYIDGSVNPVSQAKLQLNGHDRFETLDGDYFNYVQPWESWCNTPVDGVNTYSFALKPYDHQPSGTANFSRIDTTELFLTFERVDSSGRDVFRDNLDPETKISVYTVNYNVLRIMSGMGGLAYSN